MAVKCAAKSLLERKQGLQRGVWEQNSAESAANDERPEPLHSAPAGVLPAGKNVDAERDSRPADDELLIDAERVMLLAAILVSARLLRRSAAAASVSGRWRRLDGLKEGDFTPLGKGRDGASSDRRRSRLGLTTELAPSRRLCVS